MTTALLDDLNTKRLRAWEAAKEILDRAEQRSADERELTGEEERSYQRANAELDRIDARIKDLVEGEKRAADATAALTALGAVPAPRDGGPSPARRNEELRSFLRGETKAVTITANRTVGVDEYRTLSRLTAAAGQNTVPTSFYDRLVAHLIEVSGVLNAGPTVLNTGSGESFQIPKTTGHSTGALTAEAAAISASDPTFGQVTLGAYKYAVLIQVSNELLNDTAVDLEGYLAMQAGRAVGNALGAHLVTGTGTSQPTGVVTGSTLGVTGGTAVSGAFTADNLIDLHYSVTAPYRNSPSCGWLLKDATLASVRKLKDTTNQYLWQPSVQAGAPDMLYGKPVYTDPFMPAVALSAKSVVFGDISQYYVRTVDGVRFEQSREFAFSSDLNTYRCIIRADGNLVDLTGAVKYFQGAAS